MTASTSFIAHIEESLAGLGRIAVRRMFGGAGVFCDGVMLGLIADDVLYLKADRTTAEAFAAEGLGPFVYQGKGRPVTMSYWRVPERLHDDADEMRAWACRALEVARSARPSPKAAARKSGGRRR